MRFLASTGLRILEASFLRVHDIDTERGVVIVRGSATESFGHIIEKETKSGTWRSVPIPRSIANELRRGRHSTAAMTDRYSHLFPETPDDVAGLDAIATVRGTH